MALTKCSECGREVSDKAAACLGCGAPIAPERGISLDSSAHASVTRTGAKWEGLGFILIIAGMLAAMASDGIVGTVGGVSVAAGFVVFLIGRFL